MPWPVLPLLGFYLLGLGSYAVVGFGFLSAYTVELRWALSTRIALLLFVVPALVSLGRPVALTRAVLSGVPLRVVGAVLASRSVRILGNAIFGPLLAIAAFSVFLIPLAGTLRGSTLGEAVITVTVPIIGLLMVLPIVENTSQRTSFFITAEFPAVLGVFPTWFPNPLRDQQLAGDLLWFLAEVSDVPLLILLFIRWSKKDRREAKEFDDITDEEMETKMQEHLHPRRG